MSSQQGDRRWSPVKLVWCRVDGRLVIGELEVLQPCPPTGVRVVAPIERRTRASAWTHPTRPSPRL